MGLEVGGHEKRADWPKMGPSLLIATCLVLAIRTARWPAEWSEEFSEDALDKEIKYAAHLAGRVLTALVSKHPSIFPEIKKPWFKPDGEEVAE